MCGATFELLCLVRPMQEACGHGNWEIHVLSRCVSHLICRYKMEVGENKERIGFR